MRYLRRRLRDVVYPQVRPGDRGAFKRLETAGRHAERRRVFDEDERRAHAAGLLRGAMDLCREVTEPAQSVLSRFAKRFCARSAG